MAQFRTSTVTDEVELRDDDTAQAPETIISMWDRAIKRFGDKEALHVKRGENWSAITFNEYYDRCRDFAKSLISVGLKRYDGVSIIGFNSPEWLVADYGCIFAGGVAAGVYPTNGQATCEYIAEHSESAVAVCDGYLQLKKYLGGTSKMPNLKALVIYNEPVPEDINVDVPVYTFDQFMKLGANVPDDELEQRMRSQKPNQCCAIIYTSGTTGEPKGAMLHHDNMVWQVKGVLSKLEKNVDHKIDNGWSNVSYLPMSHVAAQVLDLLAPVCRGMQIWFAQPDALKGTILNTLKEVRPTLFIGVPRVWEKFAAKLQAMSNERTGTKKAVADWAQKLGSKKSRRAQFDGDGKEPFGMPIADKLALRKVKTAIGLDKAITCITAAAPISKDAIDLFASLDIQLYDLYGASEASGAQAFCIQKEWKTGSIGRTLEGSLVRTDPQTNELLIYGRNVMMGYLKNEEGTREAIDDEGWLHTGDCARIDEDGFISIIGRIKELIITAGGENIPPLRIEATILEEVPLLSAAMVVGDRRKFLSALFTLPSKPDPQTGRPTNELDDSAIKILRSIGSDATTVQEAQVDVKVKAYLDEGLKRINQRAISHAQRVNKFAILDQDFSLPGGELTPTLKLKRRVVLNKYADLIEEMYNV